MIFNSKFVFFGTPEFAAIILQKLIAAGFIPEAVVCNPDRPIGRKQIITPPPVKLIIRNEKLENRVKILQPEKLDPSLFTIHNSLFDFFVVAAYAKIIPQEILNIPKLGTIGVHPSLLPKYRGASPIQSAILNGEKQTGVTLYLLDAEMDHGPILKKEKLEIKNDNFDGLLKRLAESGGELLVRTLPEFLNGKIKPEIQNETEATFTTKFKTEDGFASEEILKKAETEGGLVAELLERKIRAFNPEPGVWTIINDKRIKLLEAKIIDGKIKITLIQTEGGKPVRK